jgi:hypothetical protein
MNRVSSQFSNSLGNARARGVVCNQVPDLAYGVLTVSLHAPYKNKRTAEWTRDYGRIIGQNRHEAIIGMRSIEEAKPWSRLKRGTALPRLAAVHHRGMWGVFL